MTIAELLDRMGYAKSENYLREDKGDFNRVLDYGHLLRKAAGQPCRLHGVYALRETKTGAIPVVYVCDVQSEEDATTVHRLVWNQDTVPFLIVNSPSNVRVYPGFCHKVGAGGAHDVNNVLRAFGAAGLETIAETLSAIAVDTGETWRAWGRHIRPEYRVDWRLLTDLRELDQWLQGEGGLAREDSHALIGKYVYLHYLRDREILSHRKLEAWKIDSTAVFGRNATRDGLKALQTRLDEWLNGEIFPVDFGRPGAPKDKHVAQVAATFAGDQPLGSSQWQLHLDFKAYDFSYIPIEVLSVVYEQFLHQPGEEGSQSKGRSAGAYYTPIPVVNLMLSELEERRPLRRGMRVFDPSCGSGAFLVQAFRRLIEKDFPPSGRRPTPRDLRELVLAHFVGLDADEDACRVTRLSLILTLLDYVRPPDLEIKGRPGPKPLLPNLRETIVCGNFFGDDAKWKRLFADKKADWVVGNPPWKQLKSNNMRPEDKPVLAWIKANHKTHPVGNLQMARAFAWRAAEYVSQDGEIALFLPAMSLFEEAARRFRSRFLKEMTLHTVANFSNLRWVISAGRFSAPAAAFFYRPRPPEAELTGEESIRTYSPLVANQEATRPIAEGERNESWSIVVNASEIREVPLSDVADGAGLPWKIAAWGSHLDVQLIRSLVRRFKALGKMESLLVASEGPQLRDGDPSIPPEGMEPVRHLVGKKVLNMTVLEGLRDFFAFPPWALERNDKCLLRTRGGRSGLDVCRAPHVIVSDARNFAVYSEDFVIVPPRQIGIVSPVDDRDLLKALSLFLSSDFAFYYEFLASTHFGVERDVSTLKTLRTIPTPLAGLGRSDLKQWANLHDRLAKATRKAYQKGNLYRDSASQAVSGLGSVVSDDMITEMNSLVYSTLGLGPCEQSLVRDLVRVRLALNNGHVGKQSIDPPIKKELRAYGMRLQEELDEYISGELPGKHHIAIVYDDHSALVRVRLDQRTSAKGRVPVLRADAREAAALNKCRERLRQTRSQWVYFDRNLRVYDGTKTYVLKPMQRFQWTETQARVDAMEIVPESIARRDKT